MSLVLASFFVIITTVGLYFSNRIFQVRLKHEEKTYAQREVLIDLLTKHDREVVDEAVTEWLAEHIDDIKQDAREEMERVYRDVLHSILNTTPEALGGSHDQPQRPV